MAACSNLKVTFAIETAATCNENCTYAYGCFTIALHSFSRNGGDAAYGR
jgi:hypothetical protein